MAFPAVSHCLSSSGDCMDCSVFYPWDGGSHKLHAKVDPGLLGHSNLVITYVNRGPQVLVE